MTNDSIDATALTRAMCNAWERLLALSTDQIDKLQVSITAANGAETIQQCGVTLSVDGLREALAYAIEDQARQEEVVVSLRAKLGNPVNSSGLRRDNEPLADYRVACGWDGPDAAASGVRGTGRPEWHPLR